MATFWVDGLLLGVEIEQVQEVLLGQNVTPVPLADGAVVGLLNLRGRLAAVIDLRHRLGLPPRGPGDAPVHFVIHSDGEPVSLIVDREGEVVEVDDRSAEPVPETVSPTIRAFLTEAHQLDGPLLLVLHADRAITLSAGLREVAHAGTGH
jgi:purine-binding chemotaxis protein CheW